MENTFIFFRKPASGGFCTMVCLALLFPFFCIANRPALYTVKAQIDPVKSSVRAQETITFQLAFAADSIPMIFNHTGNLMNLISDLRVNKKPAKVTALSKGDITGFYITGFEKLSPGEKQEISFEFKSDSIAYSDGYFAAQQEWMPMMPFYDNAGFHIVQAGLKDFDMTITIPQNYTPVTTGIISFRKKAGAEWVLKSAIKQVTYYGICLSDKFMMDQAEAGGIKIYSYYFKEDAKWGKKLLEMAKNAVSFYKKHFGFYPPEQLSILPGFNHPYGGFPISSNMYVIHRGLDEKGADADNFAQWITAHEAGHFYWGFGNVLFDQNYSIWFQISMGIYADWLFSNDAGLDKNVYEFDKRYMAGVLNDFNTTIMQPVDELEKVSFDYNNVIDHGKSFTVLMMLRNLLGTETFEKIYTGIMNNYKGKLLTLNDFEQQCEQQSGKDLKWFFNEWYKTNGYVDYNISNVKIKRIDSANSKVTCYIANTGSNYMPLDIQLETIDGKKMLKTIDGNFHDTTSFVFNTAGVIKTIQIDPFNKLPLLTRYKQDTVTIFQAVSYALGAQNYSKYPALLSMAAHSQKFNPNNNYYLLYGQLLWHTGQYDRAVDILTRAANECIGYNAERALLELGQVYDIINNRKKALECYEKEIATGKDKNVKNQCSKYLKTPYKN